MSVLLVSLLFVSLGCYITPAESYYTVTGFPDNYPNPTLWPLNTNLLNFLADEYVLSLGPDGTINNAEFTFVFVPVWCINTVSIFNSVVGFFIDNQDFSDENVQFFVDDILGLLYWSGYWGGQWTRYRIEPVGSDTPAETQAALNALIGSAVAALNAWNGSNPDPITYANNTLITASSGLAAAESVGYNAGYQRVVFDNPPPGLTSSPAWNINFDPTQVFNVGIATSQLPGPLEMVRRWQQRINSHFIQNTPLESLRTLWLNDQNGGYTTGEYVWTNILSVDKTISQNDFTTLLQAGSGFLEIIEYDALVLSESVGEESSPLAKQAALVHAAALTFTGGYGVGLSDPEYDNESPHPFPTITPNK